MEYKAEVIIKFTYPINPTHYKDEESLQFPTPQQCVDFDKEMLKKESLDITELLTYADVTHENVEIKLVEE